MRRCTPSPPTFPNGTASRPRPTNSRSPSPVSTIADACIPQWGSIELLKEANPQELWINPVDAESRGIKQGDRVSVKNEFGETQLLAKVTPRIVPGTVAMAQGAWHDADMQGDRIDRGGCINTLTTQRPSPLAKGNPQHSNICNVSKA